MKTRYLLHFVHEHISFRWTEFLALTSKYNCEFKLISEQSHILTRPFLIIELLNNSKEQNLISSVKDGVLIKDAYELWAQSNISIEDLAMNASKSRQCLSGDYSQSDQCYRINVETFRGKLRQDAKIELIKKMTFFESFEARPNLSQPKQTYGILIMNDKDDNGVKASDPTPREYYFGRHLDQSDRGSIKNFSLKTRKFIANTSMDPALSIITANAARVNQNDLVYDPFVGSGSLLIAAAHRGAYVIGGDIDWMLMHAKSKPSRKGKTKWDDNESVRANFQQYKLGNHYLDILVSDITRKPFRDNLEFNAIVADPPYGVRECSEKIGATRGKEVCRDGRVRYPSKISYTIVELLKDLLTLSAVNLCLEGRLVYWLPVTKVNLSDNFKDYIPSHPCLKLISYCEQVLFSNISRLMVVMEKSHSYDGSKPHVPQIISEMNFRDTYFGVKNDSTSYQCAGVDGS